MEKKPERKMKLKDFLLRRELHHNSIQGNDGAFQSNDRSHRAMH